MIRVNSLNKSFGSQIILKNLSFEINKGEVVGFVGANGAGKTTTLRLLSGYMFPDSGDISIEEIDLVQNTKEAQKKIGYLPENNPLWQDLSVSEYLELAGRFHQLDAQTLKNQKDYLADACRLSEVWNKAVPQLSKGYKQRLGLALCLIHNPSVLILDEPTTGLDPLQILEFRKLISSFKQNKTIIFSSHILNEVEVLCNRVLMIHDQKVTELAVGTNSLETEFLKRVSIFTDHRQI